MHPKGLIKRDDIIYLSIFIVVFLIALRNYMISPPYTLGDTTILPSTNPGLYTPSATIQYYLSLLIGENNLIKTLNFLAFIIAPISIYFTLGRKGDFFKRLILPLIFTLNPISISIFYDGNGEGILLVYSLQPLVYYLTYKMLYEVKNRLKYLIYLSIVEVVGQIFFFQMFLFSLFFQLPFILLSIKERKYLFLVYPILADLLGFLSELSWEVYLYIGVVPSVLVSPSNTLVRLGLAYYSTIVSALLFAIVITTAFIYRNKYALATLTSVGILLVIYAILQNFRFDIPVISALLAAITTFQTKVYLLSFGLLDLSLFYLKRTREFIIPLLSLLLIVLLVNTGGLQATTYSIFSFKPQPMPSWYYELYDYLSQNNPNNVYSLATQYQYLQYLPGFSGFIYDTSFIHNLTNPFYGMKYLISTSQMNYTGLRLVKTFGPVLVYYNENFTGLVHYLNGSPVSNYSISDMEIRIYDGNPPFVVSLPYSEYWTSAENYNGFLELTTNISQNSLTSLVHELFFVSLFFLILPFILLILEKTPMKTLIVGR
ncbi:hypothetical protein SULI_03260 [Saccharolobus solfataricus]|nr:hypothetical protein [Saccharolobus solfataricus]AKA73031.1 hypothetical protein SULB_0639 [Saccharolobus solfataricus]AKA75729.1 hypothetical protein SULC_0637 [Saccharolobus solfataricus]AKA78421.1 hypothetical protein SULA_0637 [Saccharolobus solfataricus]AZF67539.1 hypothetical protein SULG_03260 [Saccharolobus solfataricus]AZF70159.1 hypothetical protein SULH_03260 [Saccharolobus solfataricus]